MKNQDLLTRQEQKRKWVNRSVHLMGLTIMVSNFTQFSFNESLTKSLPILISFLPIKYILHIHYDSNQFLGKQKDIIEIKKLYQDYLKQSADLFQRNGITEPFQVASFFEHALYQGLFSKELEFETKKINCQHEISSLYGERVMSGIGCCRHIATLFDDFTSYLPVESSYLSTFFCFPKEVEPIKKHAVNVLEVNGKKMVKDFTNKKDYLFKTDMTLINPQSGNLLFLSEEQNLNQKLLKLPALEKEEYQKFATCPIKDQVFEEFYVLQEQAKSDLERICQVEESYTIPRIKKAKVYTK